MDQKEFIKVLQKYRQGIATPEERKLVDDWDLALDKEDISEHLPDESEMLAHVEPIIQRHMAKGKERHIMTRYSVGIAASLLLAIVSYFIVDNSFLHDNSTASENKASAATWEEIANDTKATQRIVLRDGSVVLLEPNSQLKYPTLFSSSERTVHLEGQAFFEVSHDSNHPFFVYANEVTTKVLGTSFMVKALPGDREITVAVRTGKVSVFTKKDSADLRQQSNFILTPNQQVVYDRKEEKISRTIVDVPVPLLSDKDLKGIKFEEASVSEIFKAMERMYRIDLIFDEEKFSTCILTTTIADDGLYKKLDIICRAVGGEYKIKENRIVIDGVGCK